MKKTEGKGRVYIFATVCPKGHSSFSNLSVRPLPYGGVEADSRGKKEKALDWIKMVHFKVFAELSHRLPGHTGTNSNSTIFHFLFSLDGKKLSVLSLVNLSWHTQRRCCPLSLGNLNTTMHSQHHVE